MPSSGVCSSSGGGVALDDGQGPSKDWKAIVVGSLPRGCRLSNVTNLNACIGVKVWSSSDEHLENWTQYKPTRPKVAIDPEDPCTMCPDDVPLSVHASYIGDNYGWSEPPYGTPSTNRTYFQISGAGCCPDTGPHAQPWCGWPGWDMPPGSSNASSEHPQLLVWESKDAYTWRFKSVMWELPGAQNGFQTEFGGVWTNNRFDCPDSWQLPDWRQIITILGSLWGIGNFDRDTGKFAAEHTGAGGCGPQQSMYDDKGRCIQFCSEGFSLPGANYRGMQSFARQVKLSPDGTRLVFTYVPARTAYPAWRTSQLLHGHVASGWRAVPFASVGSSRAQFTRTRLHHRRFCVVWQREGNAGQRRGACCGAVWQNDRNSCDESWQRIQPAH